MSRGRSGSGAEVSVILSVGGGGLDANNWCIMLMTSI